MNRISQRRPAFARAALTTAVTASALVVGACLATPAFAGSWSPQASVPTASTALAPAEATSGSTLYLAYTTSSGGIDYKINTGSWWPKTRSVSAKSVTPSTTSSPAIAVFNGDLWVFWINSSGDLRYTDDVSGTWQPTQTVSGSWGTALSSATPSLAVASGDLWVVYKGHSTDNIYYTDTTGTSWSNQQTAVSNATSDSPTVAATGISAAPIAIAWTTSSYSIGYGILGFLGFENIGTVPQAGTNAGPELAFMPSAPGETMYVAWKGHNTDGVFYSEVTNFSESSFGPSSWGNQAALPSALTSATPALGVLGTTLFVGYKGRTLDTVFYESATTPGP
jgi:hypothetical protein